MNTSNINGVILYEGKNMLGSDFEDIVVIATFKSKNRKTGPMIQVWILPKNMNPLDNTDNCGVCPIKNACYVTVIQAPNAIWKAYQNGSYPQYEDKTHRKLFRGRNIRWGAYGDPACIPLGIVRKFNKRSKSWTGYTHQHGLNRVRDRILKKYFMFSVETDEQRKKFHEEGVRVFQIIDSEDAPLDTVMCPNYTKGVSCDDCLLCKGTALEAKSVVIKAHGVRAGNLQLA